MNIPRYGVNETSSIAHKGAVKPRRSIDLGAGGMKRRGEEAEEECRGRMRDGESVWARASHAAADAAADRDIASRLNG